MINDSGLKCIHYLLIVLISRAANSRFIMLFYISRKNQPNLRHPAIRYLWLWQQLTARCSYYFLFWDTTNGGEASSNYTQNEHNAHYRQGYVDGVSTFNNDLIQQNCDSTFRVGNLLDLDRVDRKNTHLPVMMEIKYEQILDKLNVNSIFTEKNLSDRLCNFLKWWI